MRRTTGAALAEIEVVYRRRLDELCSVAAAIVGDRDAARDVVQDAFAAAVRARGSFRGDGPLDAWLWRTVVNAAADSRRRRSSGAEAAGALARLARTNGHPPDATADVHDALARLGERQRLVLFLRYYADLDYRTIGDVLGITAGAVGATLHAAHAALRSTLEEVTT